MPPFVRFLQQQSEMGSSRIFATDGILYPDLASAYALSDIRALDALYIDRYFTYIRTFIAPGATVWFTGAVQVPFAPQALLGAQNRWFDVAGVRYVVSRPGVDLAFPDERLVQAFVEAYSNPDGKAGRAATGELYSAIDARTQSPMVSRQAFTIDGISKPVLFEHPPTAIRVPITVAPGSAHLHFSLALSPLVWAGPGAGVGFEVAVDVDGIRRTVYRREIDPKHNTDERHWLDGDVDLSPYAGEQIGLVLITDPLGNADAAWAGWGDLRLQATSEARNDQYRLIYDSEVRIYENLDAQPRASMVYDVISVADPNEAMAVMLTGRIDPRRSAVAEGIRSVPSNGRPVAPVLVSIARDEATGVVVDVDTDTSGFLVLADAFYPGWTADVDGEETGIYATDLAFRGVAVPGGHHRISFYYRPTTAIVGLALAGVAAVVLGLGLPRSPNEP